MAAISVEEWGMSIPFDVIYEAKQKALFSFPIAPACSYWQDSTTDDNLKMEFDCRYELDTDTGGGEVDAYHLHAGLTSESDLLKAAMPDRLTPGWMVSPLQMEAGPTAPVAVSPYSAEEIIPYVYGHVRVVDTLLAAAGTDTGRIYGFDVGTYYDNAFDGVDLELFDYTDSAAYAENTAGASFLISRMICEGYNCLIHGASWRIGVAACEETR